MFVALFITYDGGMSISCLFIISSSLLCGPFLGAHSGGVNMTVLKEVFSDILLTLECV
jgi:hypothetical protein